MTPETLSPGHSIEVRNHYCSTWCLGFEIAASTGLGYLVRRCSDQYVLPVPFAASEVRAAG